MRPEIKRLILLGQLPSEGEGPSDRLEQIDTLVRSVAKPVTNDEARALAKSFGEDGCFGIAWSILHLIETAPGWPLADVLSNNSNPWITELRNRAIRGGAF